MILPNPLKKHLSLLKTLRVLSFLIFFLIVLGGMVRNLGAGLSCPDWPLCFGKILPHFNIEIFSEFFHRFVAGLVSLIFLGVLFYTYSQKSLRLLLGRLMGMALILLISQVVLGGLTVLKLLQSEIVTLHLATGTLFFSAVLIMTLRLNRMGDHCSQQEVKNDGRRKEPSSTWRLAIIALVALYIQIIFGGVVSSHHAGLACLDQFPKCLGTWWPGSGFEGIVGIHLVHRIGALISFLSILVFCYNIETQKKLPRHILWKARVIFLLVLIQIALGICNVLFHLPAIVSVSHLAVAEALFALILINTYELRHYELR